MRRFLLLPLAVFAVLPSGGVTARPRLAPEAEIARALEGREAGEPVGCISLRRIRSSRIIDDTAILYETGSTIYLNRPRGGAQGLDRWDVLVTETYSDRLCSIDSVKLYDATSGITSGFVLLGDFVPYRKAARAR